MTTATKTIRQQANRAKKVLDAAGFNKATTSGKGKFGIVHMSAGYTVSVIQGSMIRVDVSATGGSGCWSESDVLRNRDAVERAKNALTENGFEIRGSNNSGFFFVR